MLNERQKDLLYLIVYDYIKYGNPVSSFSLLKINENITLSSATIRNEMMSLEKDGYIEKAYKSSGRIPTNKGYEFYIKNIKKTDIALNSIKERINLLFKNRQQDIEYVIDESIKIITEATNTFAVSVTDKQNVKIEDMRFYKINPNKFIAIIIDSNGKLYNKEISVINNQSEKIEKALKIISKRILSTKVMDLEIKLSYIFELIASEINEIENEFQNFIVELFKKVTSSNEKTNGFGNIVKMNFFDKKEQMEKIINIIEENSIWDLIEKSKPIWNDDTEILINLESENLEDISIINKTFQIGDSRKRIAFIGSKKQDYEKVMNIIDILDKKMKE